MSSMSRIVYVYPHEFGIFLYNRWFWCHLAFPKSFVIPMISNSLDMHLTQESMAWWRWARPSLDRHSHRTSKNATKTAPDSTWSKSEIQENFDKTSGNKTSGKNWPKTQADVSSRVELLCVSSSCHLRLPVYRWCWLMLVYVGWCCSCPNLCWNCLRPFGFRQQHVLGSVGQRAWKSHWPRIHKDSTWPSVTHVNDFWTFALLMPHFSTCSQNLILLLGQRMSISCSCWFCDNMYQHATCRNSDHLLTVHMCLVYWTFLLLQIVSCFTSSRPSDWKTRQRPHHGTWEVLHLGHHFGQHPLSHSKPL